MEIVGITYFFKHKKDADEQTQYFSIEEIENGEFKDFEISMKKDGYILTHRSAKLKITED